MNRTRISLTAALLIGAFKLFKPHLCMFFFIVGRFLENG